MAGDLGEKPREFRLKNAPRGKRQISRPKSEPHNQVKLLITGRAALIEGETPKLRVWGLRFFKDPFREWVGEWVSERQLIVSSFCLQRPFVACQSTLHERGFYCWQWQKSSPRRTKGVLLSQNHVVIKFFIAQHKGGQRRRRSNWQLQWPAGDRTVRVLVLVFWWLK